MRRFATSRVARAGAAGSYGAADVLPELEALLSQVTVSRPLLDIDALEYTSVPPKRPINFQRSIPPAFVALDRSVGFRAALHNGIPWHGRYDARMTVPNLGQAANALDSIEATRKEFDTPRQWHSVPPAESLFMVKFPDNARAQMLDAVQSMAPLDETIAQLLATPAFAKYSYGDVVFLFATLAESLEGEPRGHFLAQLGPLLGGDILHFHDRVLVAVVQTLLASQKGDVVSVVNTVAGAYNDQAVADTSAGFLARLPPAVVNDYLVAAIAARDLKVGKTLLECLVSQEMIPGEKTVHAYVTLASELCQALPVGADQREMLFNSLTQSLRHVLVCEGMLSPGVVAAIVAFVRPEHLGLLVNYMEKNPQFGEGPLREHMLRVVIERLRAAPPLRGKAMNMMALVRRLGFEPASDIEAETRAAIVGALREFHQPLPAEVWQRPGERAENRPSKSSQKRAHRTAHR